jgi:hypothetical protein
VDVGYHLFWSRKYLTLNKRLVAFGSWLKIENLTGCGSKTPKVKLFKVFVYNTLLKMQWKI